ncbi:microcystin dependent protein, putative [Rhodobacteraceae bacterium HTCC2150]|nr:microcystin dependent protein, putative [Rhodobacteraceae bacterium HTCC2150]
MRNVFLSAAVVLGMTATIAPTTAQAQSDPLLGQMMTIGFNFCPRGWAMADGQILPISTNTALFSLLGTTYGGDGRTTFGLPDLRGRSAVHVGQGSGLDPVTLGERGGANTTTLTVATMPSHNHIATSALKATTGAQVNSTADGNALATAPLYSGGRSAPALDATLVEGSVATTVSNTGSGQSFNINGPFLGMYTCIAIDGQYPSRN